MPTSPLPPRTVADVARINSDKSMGILAMVKSMSNQRESKSGHAIVDVELVDNSKSSPDMLASIMVSVFGKSKVDKLKPGATMVFFNLSIVCGGRGAKPTITHYANAIMQAVPEGVKTTELRENAEELSSATNTNKLTAEWAPSREARDVSGPQVLSCSAFLDFTTERPSAQLPPVCQIM